MQGISSADYYNKPGPVKYIRYNLKNIRNQSEYKTFLKIRCSNTK